MESLGWFLFKFFNNMKKHYQKLIYFIPAILFGAFMIIYGGYDDSPGAQLIGLIALAVGVFGLARRKKKTSN